MRGGRRTGFPQAVARVERLCSDYYLLQSGGWGPQRMELGKNREDREGESSSLGEVAIGLELTEEGQQSREGIKTRPSDTERP